jgi:hypothetical protein
MDDSQAATQAVEGLLLVLGAVGLPIATGVSLGLGALASAAGYFFGVKHQQKRTRKAEERKDSEVIQNILNSKEIEDA